jgi:Arc/MetJ-type ribon-helix-helix transcriptional regulator
VNVELTPDQKVLVRQAVESGRLAREEDAVLEAMAIWEERERNRLEILAMVDEAEASLARGDGRVITADSMQTLAERTKARLRCRIATDHTDASR